ncbi:MAG TPA: NAD(P)/FAD-dependent oxidoreductase [Roseiflexaceae bacterium]|nr:NAD(P)/FAD-dependent oxidoreductase [Roseiflexaceae bacterium]
MHDLIIVGGGAAALSAAAYAMSKPIDTLVIAQDLGGKGGSRQQLRGQRQEERIAGAAAYAGLRSELEAHGERIISDRVQKITAAAGSFHISTERRGLLQSRALVIATGATPLTLDLPHAAELVGYGLGYSATTHAHLFNGRRVAVIGNTERALRGAAELGRTAAQVYLIADALEGRERALARMLQLSPTVEVLTGYRVTAINGPYDVGSIVVERDQQRRWLRVDAVFADLGLRPNSDLVRGMVQLTPAGFIIVDERRATSQAGLFAAGDVTTAFGEQILIAIGDGARAAVSAYDYLLTHTRQMGLKG